MVIRKKEDVEVIPFSNCHDGVGTLMCAGLLNGFDNKEIFLMHDDFLPAGVSIGTHVHTSNEEVYYLISGKGILTFDGVEYDMLPGDVSFCSIGHSHAFLAVEDSRLIVVGGALAEEAQPSGSCD